jgi:hypothetical protein
MSSSGSSSSKSSSSKSTTKTVTSPMTKAVNASKSSSSGTSSGIAGGLSMLGKSTSSSSSKSSGSKTSTATATLPSGQKVSVTIVNGKTQTAGLPAGTVVHTGGGDYKITGGTSGGYSSVKTGSTPSSSGTSSGIAGGLSMLGSGSSGSKSSSSGTSSGIAGGLSMLGSGGTSSVKNPLTGLLGGQSLTQAATGSQYGSAVPYAKAAVRAATTAANTLSQQAGTDKIGAGTQLGFNQFVGTDTGSPSLNKQADWVGQNVLPLLIPAGGGAGLAGKGLSKVAPAAVKAGSGLAAKALGTVAGVADDAAKAGTGLAQRALQAAKSGAGTVASVPRMAATVARNAPTAVKIGVPALAATGLAVNQALKEGNEPSLGLTPEGQQAISPTTQQTISTSPNTMTPRYSTSGPGGGMTIPGGTGNAMGEAAQSGDYSQSSPGFNWQAWINNLFNQNQMQQQEYPEELMIEQPEMPDFEAQQQEMLALIDQIMQQNQAMSLSYLNQMTSQLDQLQNDIIAQYQQQGTEIDPATHAALTELRNEVDRRRRGLMEEMNRRGLLQSGIWLEEENRILSNQLTAEERLLAGRLAEAQNRIMETLTSFATQRMNIMGSTMQNQMNMMNSANNLRLNALQTTQDRQNQWDQWWTQQQQAAREAAAERAAQSQSDQFNLSKWLYEQQMKQAEADRQYELDRMQTIYNVGKPYYSPNTGRSGSSMTATERKNSYLADAYSAVDQAKASGLSNDQLAQNIMNQYSDLARFGVDPNVVLDYLYQRYPEQANQGSWYTQIDNKLGGWLPFGASRK